MIKQVKVKPGKFFCSDVNATFSAKSFLDLNISRPLLRACEALGYKQPTPIQVHLKFNVIKIQKLKLLKLKMYCYEQKYDH